MFKHALTQEVVYQSILTRKRKRLHGEIGKAIEDLYRNSLDEYLHFYVVVHEAYHLGQLEILRELALA